MKTRIPGIQGSYIFVLWGAQCEEMVATTFVTELREAGLRVKLVGLKLQRSGGTHGLVLVPDLSLEKAMPLASQALGIILPCGNLGLQRLVNDPRLPEFLRQTATNRAQVVIGQHVMAEVQKIQFLQPFLNDVCLYPTPERLVEFVREIAGSWADT